MQDLSRLIGQIYDTVTDPVLWTPVLEQICDFADVRRATLILEDGAEPWRSVFYSSYSDPDWLGRYFDTYMLLNPMRIAMAGRATTGDVILTADFMTQREYEDSRFNREFLAPSRIVDIAVAILDTTATSITVLSLKRGVEHGFADEEVRRKLHLLAPHVKRASAIGRAFEQRVLNAAALADTLDALSDPVFLLDAMGMIVHASASARAMTARRDILRDVGGVLVPQDLMARSELAEALTAAHHGDTALGTRGTSIIFAKTADQATVGVVMPLTDGMRRTSGLRYRAVAALSVRESVFEAPPAATVLEKLYALTRRETTVLLTVVDTGGVPETAALMGLSDNTIKSYLKSIYRKTGATRQADLVKLVAGTASPFHPKRTP